MSRETRFIAHAERNGRKLPKEITTGFVYDIINTDKIPWDWDDKPRGVWKEVDETNATHHNDLDKIGMSRRSPFNPTPKFVEGGWEEDDIWTAYIE